MGIGSECMPNPSWNSRLRFGFDIPDFYGILLVVFSDARFRTIQNLHQDNNCHGFENRGSITHHVRCMFPDEASSYGNNSIAEKSSR
jgi:hypothetical protein